MISKQDRILTRTASDLERKYNFGKTFAEFIGIANETKKAAEDAQEAAKNLDALTQDELFNRLTNNGQSQGIYKGEDGNIYINASFIESGVITSEGEAYIPPTVDDALAMMWHVLFPDDYPIPDGQNYDLNGDGVVDIDDVLEALNCAAGLKNFADLPGAFPSPATLRIDLTNLDSPIRLYATNAWGGGVERTIGFCKSSFALQDYLDTIIRNDFTSNSFYRVTDNGEKAYYNPPMASNVEYLTVEFWLKKPVYTMLTSNVSSITYTIIRKGEAVTVDGTTYTQVWYIK